MVLLEGRTMGTVYSVKYIPLDRSLTSEKVKSDIESILRDVNRQMSTYMPGSEISKVNHQYSAPSMSISPWFAQVLTYSLDLAASTGGLFDPTVGPLVNLWGFGPGGKRKVPQDSEISNVRKYVGYKKIQLKPDASGKWHVTKQDPRVEIDLSSTAKGFAVDKVSEYLSLNGLVNHLVEIGGEIKARGFKKKGEPWVVGVENPVAEPQASPHIFFPIIDMSIATSGSYRNFFSEEGSTYSHTLDPRSGRPIQHDLVSVTVLDESCMKADGLATALMAMGPKRAWEYAIKHKLPVYMILATKPVKSEPSDPERAIIAQVRSTPAFDQITSGATNKRLESK